MVQLAAYVSEASQQKAALMERLWRCAVEDQRRMDGFLMYFHGAEACGRVYIQYLEQLREALPLPPPHISCPDTLRAHELWWSIHSARSCMLILQMQIAYAKAHMARMRGEYVALFTGLANTVGVGSYFSSPAGSSNGEWGGSGRDSGDSAATTWDQVRLRVISDLLKVKEKEQAAWRPDGMHMDWNSALLGSATVVFPQALGEIIPFERFCLTQKIFFQAATAAACRLHPNPKSASSELLPVSCVSLPGTIKKIHKVGAGLGEEQTEMAAATQPLIRSPPKTSTHLHAFNRAIDTKNPTSFKNSGNSSSSSSRSKSLCSAKGVRTPKAALPSPEKEKPTPNGKRPNERETP
ncbi:hypothetical protein Esti_001851 [Eimeria stiedai]